MDVKMGNHWTTSRMCLQTIGRSQGEGGISGGSRNFKSGGRGPVAVEFLGLWFFFYAPFTHTLCFVVRVENKVHIVNIVLRQQLMLLRVYKYNPAKNFKQGGARPARRCWIRLWVCLNLLRLHAPFIAKNDIKYIQLRMLKTIFLNWRIKISKLEIERNTFLSIREISR